MRNHTLSILAVCLVGSLLMCRPSEPGHSRSVDENVTLPRPPVDTTLPRDLQLADSLLNWRNYTEAGNVLWPYVDSAALPAHIQMRATSTWCYAAMRDTFPELKDESYRRLIALKPMGHQNDTLILAQQALSLGHYFSETNIDSASIYFDRALHLIEFYYASDHPGLQGYYRDIGSYYCFIKQNVAKSLEIFRKEESVHEEWLFPPYERFLIAYNLGGLYGSLEDYDLAESYLHRSLIPIKSAGFDTTRAAILPYSSLAYLYAHRHQTKQLRLYIDTCLALLNKYHKTDTANYVDYHCTLAMSYIPGNADIPSLGHAILDLLPVYSPAFDKYSNAFADVYRARAYLYLGEGEIAKAQESMLQAIRLFEDKREFDYYYWPGYIDALLGLGIIYLEDGKRVEEAMPYIRLAAENTFHMPLEAAATHYPARYMKYYLRWYDFLVAYGDQIIAEGDANVVSDITHLSARIDTAVGTTRQKVSDSDVLRNARLNHDIYTYMIDWCYTLTRDHFDKRLFEQAFDHFEKSRAHLLLTQLSIDSLARQLGVPQSVVDEGKALTKEELATYSAMTETEIDSLLARKEEYFNKLEKGYPEYYHKSYQPSRVTLDEILKLIGEEEAMIIHQLKDSQLYSLVITTDTLQLVKSIFGSQCTEATDRLYTMASAHPGNDWQANILQEYTEVASGLFTCVLGEVYPIIKDKKQWWIAADGRLELLPFELLIVRNEKRVNAFHDLPYLVNTYDIGYLLSVTTWQQERERPKIIINDLAVFAHSDGAHTVRSVDIQRDQSVFNGMPGTAKAAKAIRNLYGSSHVQIFSNKKATISEFYNAWQTKDLVHLGLHAYADTSGHQRHGIVFPGNRSALTIPDVIGKNAKTTIVFLEGCETAVGKQSRGEGTLNFARPFIAAGTRHVLASRWKLDDQTAGLMSGYFYGQLKSGKDVAVAACESKRIFLKQASRLQSHPYFWAAVMSVQ